MSRIQRLIAIKKFISKQEINSQNELLNLLKLAGYKLTQATLSRDLKFLKVGKVPSLTGYKYVLNRNKSELNNNKKTSTNNEIILSGFINISFSDNLAVIKTLPGCANGISYVIDKLQLFEVLGTVAGDDTIIAVMKEGISKNTLINSLILKIPKLKHKLKPKQLK